MKARTEVLCILGGQYNYYKVQAKVVHILRILKLVFMVYEQCLPLSCAFSGFFVLHQVAKCSSFLHLLQYFIACLSTVSIAVALRGGPGVKSRMCPPYSHRNRKRRLIGAVCRNHRIKRVVPCRRLDRHIKEPYEMSMALGARP